MPSVIPSATTFRAASALLILLTASADDSAIQDALSMDEDVAVHLMQSRSTMMPNPRPLMRSEGTAASAPADFDAAMFAQTDVEVAPAQPTVKEPAPVGGAKPAWLRGAEAPAQPDEDAICSLEGLTPGVCAMAALARAPPAAEGGAELDYVDPSRLERALFKEIEAALAGTHGGFSAAHLSQVEQDLSGFFGALPKNEGGRLDHATVRYAIHQRFLRGHAWYIRSLNPVGEAQTPASPGEALRGQVPVHLQKLIEDREGGRGLDLRELAALAATLEHLIEGDMAERLKATYSAHDLKPNATVSRSEVLEVLKTYMAHFLSLEHKSGYAVTPEQAREERRSIESGYGGWKKLSEIMEEVVSKRAPEGSESKLSFSEAVSAAKDVMEKFEAVSAQDCQEIKQDLSAISEGDTGRVLLSELHRKAVEGSMLFAETTEYLTTLGALEDGKGGVSVLVPNYVYSPSNCLGTTSFFDMCCPNECEVIMQQLESRLRKPEATPAEVEGVVEQLPGGGKVSHDALEELDGLAHGRDGLVTLHGYHFARWLHRTFPKVCPKPRAEEFTGARQHAEVPGAEQEYQAVAKLPFIQEEGLSVNASATKGGSSTDLGVEQLKSLAARKLGAGGLKLASGLDASSLAQTSLDVSSADDEQTTTQGPTSGQGTSGLNIKRRREL
mmetsp:Transcript_125580/g.390965  ORF Transcript_125580/g.390965 Transcript_125580/m.390965 type:complete len:670 (-) Transcript_125580:52-2061(-)